MDKNTESPIVAVPSVPREPTEAMVEAGCLVLGVIRGGQIGDIWRAMYDAAPDPASDGKGEESDDR